MARRIVDAGYPTTLWARRAEALVPYAQTPARTAASLAELAAQVDLVCVCVVTDADVDQVVSGAGGLLAALRPGSIIAIHSTVHPDTCVRLAGQAAARGVTLIDAPVSGGGAAAAEGRLLVMLGGDTNAVERTRPVFETYGDPVVHLGDVGAGQRAKLINNLLFTANLATAESAFRLARSLEVDPAQLSAVLRHGSGASFAAGVLHDPDFSLAPFRGQAGPLLRKDVRLVLSLADAAGVKPGTVLDAADAALESMGYAR
jgi:3-hydroxyisobutyrate dehydrogenase-like beta-hydroxyacid dehydrogenase